MKSVMAILIDNIGRAMRANENSLNDSLPKDQRTFHAGRREAYLQNIALIAGEEVKDIRSGVLGSGS